MDDSIKYVHTNLIAKDWKKLASYYVEVFNCERVYPERNLSGKWIDELAAIKDAEIKGIHLRLPGYTDGPTLEIFSYTPESVESGMHEVNDFGFSHIAFHVSSVEEVLQKVLANGGCKYGEVVQKHIDGVGKLTVVYTRDPEGNIVELQHWYRE